MSRPAAPGSCRVCSRGSRGFRKGPCRRADRTARDPCYGGSTAVPNICGCRFDVPTHVHRRLLLAASLPYISPPSIAGLIYGADRITTPGCVNLSVLATGRESLTSLTLVTQFRQLCATLDVTGWI